MTNFPAPSVVVLRVKPVTELLMVTVTATMTPPVGSFTVPCTMPAPPSPCAHTGVPANRVAPTAIGMTNETMRDHRPEVITLPPVEKQFTKSSAEQLGLIP